jgi:hypothetical protein
MYTVLEKTRHGARLQLKSYDDAKKEAMRVKEKTRNECNVLSDGIAVWTTEGETNTDAIYFM